jgi:carboxyl-terminal processing protease
VKALLQQLDQEEVAGVVIDLRDNGGGSLEEAITLSGLFVPPGGPVVQISYGKGRQQAIPARPTEYHSRLPVVVLVNRISASASEIFAAALQDYRRAVIVGERTFGKGTVQRIVALDKGQLKYTNATFYRIDGNTTQHQGVVPDIELPSYYDHDQIGESALSRAMPAGQIKSAQFTPVKNWLPPLERLLSRHQARAESDPELIFLKEDVQRIQNARQKREWVLDYETRLEEMEADKVLRLEMENRKRKLAGLEALESLDELDEKRIGKSAVLEEIPEEAEIVGSENEEGDELDVVLLEAARILLDMEVELASLHETRTADAK